jgi:hypothetical protein
MKPNCGAKPRGIALGEVRGMALGKTEGLAQGKSEGIAQVLDLLKSRKPPEEILQFYSGAVFC